MTTQVATQQQAPREVVQVESGQAAAILSMIERAAVNPAVDIDKMERLFEMHRQAQASQARAAFDNAMAAMQPHLPIIEERGEIKNSAGKAQSTYALWEDINEALRPILAEYGFALSFRVKTETGRVSVTGILAGHGHREETSIDLPIDTSGSKNSVQSVGSSTSYGQRYTAKLLLNITSRGADDDGKAGGMSAIAERAMTDINTCEGLDELRRWKAKQYDGLSKTLNANELREVIALFNRRLKAAKAAAEQREPVSDFPGDR
jgi:hypothetical protein